MNEELIKVRRLPEISERLQLLKEKWEQQAAGAQAMVCTEETVRAVKAARAAMRKEYEEAERQRKAAKVAYMVPWVEIEAVYNDCIKEPFEAADEAYKGKIAEVEGAQKNQCEKMCREYFAELCAVHGVEFLRYEQSGVRITIAEAKKKTPSGLFDKLNEFVARVACDVDSAMSMDNSADILVEYKQNGLNLARAIKTVQDRFEYAERERKAAKERAEREKCETEAVAKVEEAAVMLAPPTDVKEEKLLTVAFRATSTREKLIKLREFMKSEGIKYE